ncbi:MAG: hypothetical protein OEW58_00460 [Gammaproteobacteria bacterium]|nr:hypothetical protein [Gammaproteobacteria bacterium]
MIISLGQRTLELTPDLLPQVQQRHWPLPADAELVQQELQSRIKGVLGGIRMFAASDGM